MTASKLPMSLQERFQMHQACRGVFQILLEGGELRWPVEGDQEKRLRVYILGGLVEILDAIGWELSDGTGELPKTTPVLHALRYLAYDLHVSIPNEERETEAQQEERAEEETEVSLFRGWAQKLGGVQDDPRMQSAEASKGAR